jgi:nucleotide-binding universal stress UspA family protein
MLERIACATDFRESSEVASRYAASLVRTFGGSLELVHARTYLDDIDESWLLRTDAFDEWRKARQAKLDAAVARWKGRGITTHGTMLEGAPELALVEQVPHRADVLVMGTVSRRGIAHALLGSVAERVLRTATVPVLAVPKTWSIADDARFAPSSILVPIDFGPLSATTLRVALDLARPSGARVTIVHAWDQVLVPAEGPTATESARKLEGNVARWLETQLPGGAAGVSATVRRGHAFDVIESAAKDREADLVVMATAGRTGLGHLMLGSVTERVLRSLGLPVLTYRRAKDGT